MTPCEKILKAALDHKAGTVHRGFWTPPTAPIRGGLVGRAGSQVPAPRGGWLPQRPSSRRLKRRMGNTDLLSRPEGGTGDSFLAGEWGRARLFSRCVVFVFLDTLWHVQARDIIPKYLFCMAYWNCGKYIIAALRYKSYLLPKANKKSKPPVRKDFLELEIGDSYYILWSLLQKLFTWLFTLFLLFCHPSNLFFFSFFK